VSEYRFAGAWCGTRLVAMERKIITSGGFYDEAASYATMLGRYSRVADEGTAPIDLSISYDYGAEVKAFARCFRSLSGVNPPVADPALRDELRGMVDHLHSVYQTHFTIPFRTNKSTIFSRSIAFMAFAYADMLVSTNAPMYRTALREACEVILTFERQNRAVDGSRQSGFLMGQNHDEVPHVDCHSACLLALTRATVLLDEPGWLPNIDRGLAAFCLTKSEIVFSGMQKVDVVGVDYKRPYKRRSTQDTFWNFKAGLTLRLFNALRATRHSGLREVWERHATRLTPLEMLLRHNIARSLRQRDDTIEILTSMRSGETNSETQPWVALALIGEACQDSLDSRFRGNGSV